LLAALLIGYLWRRPVTGPGELLAPTGPLALGRTSYHWVDHRQQQPHSHDAPKREVMAHFWYPATHAPADATAPYMPSFAAVETAVGQEALREATGASYEALATARTHVVADAPLRTDAGRLPVVILTHGLRFNSLGYTMLEEDLAGHGYLVVGIDHPATAFAVVFPGDRATLFDESLWEQQRTAQETRNFERQLVARCAEDLVFVIDQLERLDSGAVASPFQGHLDLARIGVFGHSFGGRVAAKVCQLDRRLKAGIICDGFGREMTVEKQPNGSTIEQPMMVYYARRVPRQGWARILALLQTPGRDLEAELQAARKEFCESVVAGSLEVTLSTPGIVHESFSDIPLLERRHADASRRGQKRAIEITRSITRAFFDRHLRGRLAPLLDDFPYNPDEVELTRHVYRAH
jgi:dienelactone hydrolase